MNPVEELTIKYIRSVGGDYEQIEPQVYDVVLSNATAQQLQLPTTNGLHRLTFDTEALSDYPDAQLLAFGHPTLDQMLAMAHQQGSVGKIFLSGFNLQPHQLLLKLKKQLRIHKDLDVEFGSSRILHFTLWFYWFQATFVCDEKIQHLFEVGIDQYHGRITRHFHELLESTQITSFPMIPYPDVGGITQIEAYSLARSEAITKLRSIMRAYKATLTTHFTQESNQITKYFDGMMGEIEEQKKKNVNLGKDTETLQQKKRSLELEKKARLIELQKKMTVRVDVKLLNLLSVVMPKIATPLKLTSKHHLSADLTVVWHPLTEAVEPISCPQCHNPTLELIQGSRGAIHCTQCKS
ncbi:MAG: hypothetical protein WB791_06240 [Waddliaceae bacterium]